MDKPTVGGIYQLRESGLYMCTGSCIRASDGVELTKYAAVTTGTEYAMPMCEFTEKFTLEIPPAPSMGLPAIAYLWTATDGTRITTFDPEEFKGEDLKREALVRLEDAYAKWSLERVQHMALQLRD